MYQNWFAVIGKATPLFIKMNDPDGCIFIVATSRSSLRLLVRNLGMGWYATPPPSANERSQEAPAPCVLTIAKTCGSFREVKHHWTKTFGISYDIFVWKTLMISEVRPDGVPIGRTICSGWHCTYIQSSGVVLVTWGYFDPLPSNFRTKRGARTVRWRSKALNKGVVLKFHLKDKSRVKAGSKVKTDQLKRLE